MKSVLISVRPKWCELITSGKKTIEVRKSAPKEVPFKAYIYCCKAKSQWRYSDYEGAYGNSKGEIVYAQQHIIGEFICDRVICCQAYYGNSGEKHLTNIFDNELQQTCLTEYELFDYIVGNKKEGTGWFLHISELKIYDEPRELSEFRKIKCTNKKGSCSNCDIKPNCIKTLTRPPQSWCFIEGLGE